jgi:uncharacterized membrane protein YphA (DoxX/SURF4 family)
MEAAAILIAQLIFALVFSMAAAFKFMGMDATAAEIESAGLPFAAAHGPGHALVLQPGAI